MGFMSSIIYVGSIVLQPGINSLGYETIAGHTAARKLFSFSMMPLSSMAQAVNTYVAQNRGADNWERVRKGIRYAYIFCFSVTACLIVIVTPLAPTMVHLISGSSDPTVLGNGARYLRVAIPFSSPLVLSTAAVWHCRHSERKFCRCCRALLSCLERLSLPWYLFHATTTAP